jgi:hypothetical protein
MVMGPTNVIFSATNALNKWLKLDLPRIHSPDGKRIGTQPLLTDAATLSWQCHVVENAYQSGKYTVIAVESYSRFTMLLPYDYAPKQDELQQALCLQWIYSLFELMADNGAVSWEREQQVVDQFYQGLNDICWYRNTDLSINGHVADAEQWVKQTLNDQGKSELDDDLVFDLARHINSMFKRAPANLGKKVKFYPVPRFINDGLFRFAKGLSEFEYEGAVVGDFLNPYDLNVVKQPKPNNVVSLAVFASPKTK